MTQASASGGELSAGGLTFVLVHGGWHGGWCWQRVVDRLRALGHFALAPTLSGLAERADALSADIDLHTHIADVVDAIQEHGLDNLVLVGHSYGGWVISGVVERVPQAIRSMVFVDAFVPDGRTSQLTDAPEHLRRAVLDKIAAGAIATDPPPAAAFDINEGDRPWVDSMMTPMPINTFTTVLSLTGARERVGELSYVRATGHSHPAFEDTYGKVCARPEWRTYELPGGHDLMLDSPDELVKLLVDIA